MSASTNSPPLETPIEEHSPISPVHLTLPKPPSFSAHRRRSTKTVISGSDSDYESEAVNLDHDGQLNVKKDGRSSSRHSLHRRSVSFDINAKPLSQKNNEKDDEGEGLTSPGVYRIPQRSPRFRSAFDPVTDDSDKDHKPQTTVESDRTSITPPASILKTSRRAPPPRALNLTKSAKSNGNIAPAPITAPTSHLSGAGAARGLTISPALSRPARASFDLGARGVRDGSLSASIWSAGPKPSSGWTSPALGSARSVLSSTRQRGLTVAVIKKDDGDMVVESAPITPGLASAVGSASAEPKSASLSTGKLDTGSSDFKRKEIILCRYYHTPGLTCTSRPCRFVHALESLGAAAANRSLSAFPMLSPRPDVHASPDPTSGTFALAQSAHTATGVGRRLSIKDTADFTHVAPGETVTVIDDETGQEVVGHVFMMSGGGKGPAGKSKAKFKTVPCKDFADGHCPYGNYCSFIHDWNNLYDATIHGDQSTGEASAKSPGLKSSAQHCKTSSLPSWTEAIAKDLQVPNVAVKPEVMENGARRFSAFAAPFSDKQVVVDKPTSPRTADPLSPRIPSPRSSPRAVINETVPTPQNVPVVDKSPKVSAWSKGPPTSLKRVVIAESTIPESPATPSTGGHLVPPSATYSLFGTGSDPATPWDPAIHAEKLREAEEAAAQAQAEAEALRAQARTAFGLGQVSQGPGYLTAPSLNPSLSEPIQHYYYKQNFPALGEKGTYTLLDASAATLHHNDMPPWTAPMYPWGIPMSPITPNDKKTHKIVATGAGVIWTPAGWAVQDAAMKQAMIKAELTSQNPEHQGLDPKVYYKTRVCKFFIAGDCPFGDHCTYIHPSVEQGTGSNGSSKSSPVKNPAVFPSQPARVPSKHRTLPCKFFNSAIGCNNGDSCNFLHTKVIPEDATPVAKPRPWRTRPCRHFQTGRCVLGDACHFAHVIDPKYKDSAPCLNWRKTGRCLEGKNCKYAHNGEGGEGNAEVLTEDRLAIALEEIKMSQSLENGVQDDDDEDDDEDDDVEIVTVET